MDARGPVVLAGEVVRRVLHCPECGHRLPVEIVSVTGAVELRVYCRHCRREIVVRVRPATEDREATEEADT